MKNICLFKVYTYATALGVYPLPGVYSRRRKKIIPTKNKYIFDKTGFSLVWNEGRGPMYINANLENEIKIVLESQMIQKWSEEIKKKIISSEEIKNTKFL